MWPRWEPSRCSECRPEARWRQNPGRFQKAESPVPWTTGLEEELTELSVFRAAIWPVPEPAVVNKPGEAEEKAISAAP